MARVSARFLTIDINHAQTVVTVTPIADFNSY